METERERKRERREIERDEGAKERKREKATEGERDGKKERWRESGGCITGWARARRGRITGLGMVDVTVWRVAWVERTERGGGVSDTAKGEPARVAAMGEKIDILIGQNNWNERTNGRS